MINDEIDQLKNLSKKINLNQNGIINSLNKINYNKDFILKINEKYEVIANDLKLVKKLVSIFGNDYDLFSYLIKFPNKIFCEYESNFSKILVSNGKSLVIKSEKNKQYYRYPLENTPLSILLNKKFIIKKLIDSEILLINDKFYRLSINEKDKIFNLFFENINFEIVGWQTEDIYQNLSVTYIYDLKKNMKVNKNLFKYLFV